MKRTLLYILLLFSSLAWAQSPATGLPYECSFEEGENLSAWTLNYGTSNTTDQWIYGTAVHSEGKRSMYVTADGSNPTYGKGPNVVVSMLRYKFPTASNTQKYDVSFDWIGTGDSATSKLYLLFCREMDLTAQGGTNLTTILNSPNAQLSRPTVQACQSLGESGEKFVCGSAGWQNVSLSNQISVSATNSQQNFVFVFIWVNAMSQDTILNSSVAIDNFQINSAAIRKPENLIVYPQCEDSTLLVTWTSSGAANEFDIQYRKTGETDWAHGMSGIAEGEGGFTREEGTKCSYAFKNILEGSYDVRIRSAYYDEETSQTLRSNYVYQSRILVYCPQNHCVNFVDLDDPSVVCTIGYFPNYNNNNETPYDDTIKVDYGPDAIGSRHTLHVDPDEVDPRTDSMLHTVPEGSLASVRLGNWDTDGEAESITYTIHVDSFTQGILIVKYAVVLEDPAHDDEPQFMMEILDDQNQLINTTCGYAVFNYSDAVDAGWNIVQHDYNEIAWKDWTTVGVNLMPYHGQDIKLRFTTRDCGWGGHFGYAYFTVDCANAHIETENCGNDAQVTCIAPEGFSYTWYRNGDITDVAGTDRTLIVDPSRTQYTCRVSFIEEPSCWFEIGTTSEPRFPVPEYTFERIYERCESKLKFNNTSHVMNKFDGDEHHTDELCNEVEWIFRNLGTGQRRETTTWSPTYKCPDQGDTIEVTCIAKIGVDNSCDSMRVDTIIVPNIMPRDSTLNMTTCSENPVKFDGKYFNTDTIYTAVNPNFAGCDSVATLFLKVLPKPQDYYRYDSICSDQYIEINGVKYNQSLTNHAISFQTPYGCDSIVYLTLTVNQRINANVPEMSYVCSDDEQLFITFDIAAGEYDSLRIMFNTQELRDTIIYDPSVTSIAIPYPDTITPGHYSAELRFYQFCCGIHKEVREFDIRYRSSIVEQKWNDVLTLLSPKYNGGYSFTAFQWYKNGELMEGENHSYLYQPLDFDATYYVELTRADGSVMATCPIQPVYHEQQSEYPTIVKAGQHVPMYMENAATVWYYTISGQLYSSFTLPQGYTTLTVPGQTGAYVIKSVSTNGETNAQVMIVQ